MAANRIENAREKHVAGTSRAILTPSGEPLYKLYRVAETDYAGELRLRTRDGATTVISYTPQGDVTVSVVGAGESCEIVRYNQREVFADMIGRPEQYRAGEIATYSEDGAVTSMAPAEYYAALEAEWSALEERQRRNAETNRVETERITPPGTPRKRASVKP